MSRATAGVDRFLVGLIGLILIGLGVLAILWERELVSWLSPTLPAAWLSTATDQGWWRWALMGAGIILVLLALYWIIAHIGRSKVGTTPLPGSDRSGRLTADLGSFASAGAQSLEQTPGVESASGSAKEIRGRRTLILGVTMDAAADVAAVVAAAEHTCAQMGQMLPDPSIAVRVDLRTTTTSGSGRSVA